MVNRKPITHGTLGGYTRCRKTPDGPCPECKAINSAESAMTRQDKRANLERSLFAFDAMPWQAEANCRGVDPGLFYPERGDDVTEPKAVCAGCTVRTPCLERALELNDDEGIWGGTSGRQRRLMRRERRAQALLEQSQSA